jgi:hypothetical protein
MLVVTGPTSYLERAVLTALRNAFPVELGAGGSVPSKIRLD